VIHQRSIIDAACQAGDMDCFVACWFDKRLHHIMQLDLCSVTCTCFVMQLQAALMLVNALFNHLLDNV